jgi:tetratricopeptide (TPR) repeat protein
MSEGHWERVKEVLHRALQLAPAQRAQFLDEICAGDAAVRREVESLLSADGDIPADFLGASPAVATAVEDLSLAPGQIFDRRFRLISKLGEGGMGQIWLAEQIEPVRRRVALKLIRAGMYDETTAQRFRAERQSLAIMDHPAIAKVFEAGTSPQGQPYFVMEYVPGVPITEYCDQKRLGIAERLSLFLQACEGVQHAHQKAIIHRDLKPGNILVVEVDGKAVPRIIDFGLAKATTPQSPEAALHTQLGHFLGTPGYMSPEQLDPAVRDIDTRADVYSLGVILYVLLTGTLPFRAAGGTKAPLRELLRRQREDEPQSPSARVASESRTSSGSAEARATQTRQLVGLLRGDLDWITLRALEKERGRRYATPLELAADLRRYLTHEPVLARPPSRVYRVLKYVRRHRLGVGIAAGVVAILCAFTVVQAMQLRRITQERDRAARITDFMLGMFKVAGPREAQGRTVTAREVLDQASANVGAALDKDPEVQADLMYVMGRVYEDLGLYAKAESLVRDAHDIRIRVLGPKSPRTLEAQTETGWELFKQRRLPEAEAVLRASLAGSRSALGASDAVTVAAMEALGDTLTEEGQLPEAERLQRSVVDIDTRTLGPDDRNTVKARLDLASCLMHQHRAKEAESLYRQVLTTDRRVGAPEYPDVQMAESNLAQVLSDEGRAAEAETLYRDSLAIERRILGPEHPATLYSMNDLANMLSDEGRYAEAEALDRQVLDIRRRVYGPDDPVTAGSTYNLACLAALTGRTDEALGLLKEAVEHGYSPQDPTDIEKDEDLKSLYDDPRFRQIVADAKRRAAPAH